MSYQVIARKWRPQNFDEMVGQEAVTRTLQNALKSGRIAHAFLFSGVRGVGKTTAARILAKALNCREEITPNPCDECVSCEEIRIGNSVDVQEIDAASNRGIDDIRELRESARYGTARDRFKIFIVDEVHMLTKEAFNALLKILEEPPSHVKFILATTEYQRLPRTITSRCQKYEFKPIAYQGILDRLRLITDTEGVKISDFALFAVASVAQGSMRDAQSALDQILAFSDREVHDEDVKALLGVLDQGITAELVQVVLDDDRGGLIKRLQDLAGSGISPQVLCGKLMERVRDLLVCKATGWDTALLQLPDSEKDQLLGQAERFSELDLIRFYDLLNRAGEELRWHTNPHVHLEIALLKLVELAHLPALETVISRLESGQLPPSPAGGTATGGRKRSETAISPASASTDAPSQPKDSADGNSDKQSTSEASASPFTRIDAPTGDPVQDWMLSLQDRFKSLYQQLQFASDVVYSEGKLTIQFPASERFHAQLIDKTDTQRRLSETFASIAGSKPDIDVTVVGEVEVEKPRVNPMEDSRVQSFLKKYPGKVVVRRDLEE
ncbi:MAG TPA: DNA polymerase III subunit gamma/tau [Acidobacteriota bacterium]|nr:DNA polymerase III subunit gamma/tau [Acidobacteriota bacterium]